MAVFGRVKNGVVVLDEPAVLPEGTQVRVEVVNGEKAAPALTERFQQLAEEWQEAVKPLSSATRMVQHPAYRAIIALGPGVIPLLLQELERQPDYWFAALKELTGANPVAPEDRGRLDRMTQAWLRWGRKNGYLQ